MRFIFQSLWEPILTKPIPLQVLVVFLLVIFIGPFFTLRFLPWATVIILQIALLFAKLIGSSLLFFDYQITQRIRKNEGKPPKIVYTLGYFLGDSVGLVESLKGKAKDLSKEIKRVPCLLPQKKWYALPLVILPIWFIGPYIGLSGLIKSNVTNWCSLEHWIMAGEWRPSELTCHYPSSSPRWDASLKTKEYESKRNIKKYTKEIKAQPNSQIYYKRGNAYLDIENIEAAFKDYTASLQIAKYAPAYVGRGNIYQKKGDKDAAFKEYSNAVNIDPKYAPAYVGRGDVYQKKGDKDAALQEYRKAIQIDSKNGLAYARIGNLYYINFGNRKAAIKEFDKAANIFLNSGQTDSYNEVISILDKLKKYYFLFTKGNKTRVAQWFLYKEACEAGKHSGVYSENGVGGLLYPSQCGKNNSNLARYKFVDDKGYKKCKGEVEMDYVGGKDKIMTRWKVQETVPGYECTTIGKEHELEMYREERKFD
ncbi:MAG: tetratricopeptide repeat protein [Okeania sp. SIO3B5]|uniref:tetratricopeptide repeat protein n=1 Tax=Okeania sp. SIO3B5 TaxID=2607811 RepID=UPI0013FF4E88|nr:tetratricopeptide repeat protein [Okeania sp. SIO3B5]NEO57634.1 tetratricopeptide repeat protein [Okeania sp. SIO3B5]